MDFQGHRGSHNPKAMLTSLLSKRQKLQEELRNVEKQVYELETSYLQETSNFGNAFKGFEGFLSSSKSTANLKRSKKFQLEDRVFSLSSVTSPARRFGQTNLVTLCQDHQAVLDTEKLGFGLEDGRSVLGLVHPKGGGIAINGPGKPKKGRPGPREGKKIRLTNDIDHDAEDDHDLSLR